MSNAIFLMILIAVVLSIRPMSADDMSSKWVDHGKKVSKKDQTKWYDVLIAYEKNGSVVFTKSHEESNQGCQKFKCPKSAKCAIIAIEAGDTQGSIPSLPLTAPICGEYFSLDYFSHRTSRFGIKNLPTDVKQMLILSEGDNLDNKLFINVRSVVRLGHWTTPPLQPGKYILVPTNYQKPIKDKQDQWEIVVNMAKELIILSDDISGNIDDDPQINWETLKSRNLSKPELEGKSIWLQIHQNESGQIFATPKKDVIDYVRQRK
jgi:hypothetical protein